MKLTRRSNGVWMLETLVDGRRVRLSTGKRDKAEAEAVALTMARDPGMDRTRYTLRDALDDTYRTHWTDCKASKFFRSVSGTVAAELGHLTVGEVTYAVLRTQAERWRAAGLKPATVNRRLAVIGKALNEAVKAGRLPAVPPMPRQREANRKDRYLSEDEEARLLTGDLTGAWVLEDLRTLRLLVVFLLDTGARLGEALKLTRADLRREPGQWTVVFLDTKNGKDRRVPLTKRALAAALHLLDGDWMPRSTDWCQHRFARLRREVGVSDDVTLHTLRHTCASRLVQAGTDLYAVAKWLGHSSITVTERYAHLAPSTLSALAGTLEGRTAVTSERAGSVPPETQANPLIQGRRWCRERDSNSHDVATGSKG